MASAWGLVSVVDLTAFLERTQPIEETEDTDERLYPCGS
jgi:hypothetical protein